MEIEKIMFINSDGSVLLDNTNRYMYNDKYPLPIIKRYTKTKHRSDLYKEESMAPDDVLREYTEYKIIGKAAMYYIYIEI